MKRKFKYIVMCTCLLLTGCSDNTTKLDKEPGKYYSVTIDEEYFNYDENSEVIQAIIETSNGFTKASFDITHKNPEVEKEFEYYSDATMEHYNQIGTIDSTRQWLLDEELVIKLHEVNINTVELYHKLGVDAARVDLEYISSYPEAREEYLQSTSVEIGQKYNRGMLLELVYENDRWAVDGYTLTAREKVE